MPLEDTVRCFNCNEEVSASYTRFDYRGRPICGACRGDYYTCDDCGDWVHPSDILIRNNERYYCPSCWEVREEEEEEEEEEGIGIHSYDYRPYPNFLPSHEPNTLYLGVELETDDYDDVVSCARELERADPHENYYYLKEDGTLKAGIEIVTHPATLAYHKNGMEWGKITGIVAQHGGKSHNTHTCGLHVHFNTDFLGQSYSIRNLHNTFKLMYIVEKFWSQLVTFSRRNLTSLAEWAGRYNDDRYTATGDGYQNDKAERVNHIKKLKSGMVGKYYAVNISNQDTIEIRLFKGTLKLSTLYASLELVDYMVRLIKKKRMVTLQKLTWDNLVRGIPREEYPNLIHYLKERGLCA